MGMLTLVYLLFAVAGCGYIVVSAFLGHLFEGADGGGHAHGGAAGGAHGHAGAGHEHGGGDRGEHAEAYGIDGGGHGTASASGVGPGVFHFPFFSPLALATLFASLGAYGIIAKHGLGVSDGASLALAVPAAAATAYAITYLGWRLVQGAQASSVIRLAELSGALAEVTTPIPPGGLGEAVAVVGGQRYSAPAREETGREVPRGAPVTVVGMVGPTLVVRAGTARQESPAHA
jgi:membrane protein implicated in regulation of membrane protease activity